MSRDPLASATLARLYIQQGHLVKARAIVDAVLLRDPLDGHALALRNRLLSHSGAALQLDVEPEACVARWRRVPDATRARIELHVFEVGADQASGHPSATVSALPCGYASGACTIPVGPGAKAAVARIVLEDGAATVTLAVSAVAQW